MKNLAFLDINDSNLQLWHADQHLHSPGYALLDGSQYQFGQSARDAARLHPRQINTRYWWQLSTEALQPALGPARHHADLVHAHLLELHRAAGEPAQLLLAAPGSMQREQLALLLGIVQQCPFDIVGLANRSTVISSLYGGQGSGNQGSEARDGVAAGNIFHLEIQLHQALLSQLSETAGKIQLQRSVPLPGCGLLQLQERLVELTAAAFIRQTRFDPRRKAQTEQQLYNALPGALQALALSEATNMEINGYRARIDRSELIAAGQQLFTSSTAAMGSLSPQDRLLTDPLAALLPGLTEHFSRIKIVSEIVPANAVHQALQRHQQHLVRSEQVLSFVSALPVLQNNRAVAAGNSTVATPAATPRPAAQEPAGAPTVSARTQPTHALLGSNAKPLQAAGVELQSGVHLYRLDQDWLLRDTAGLRINGVEPLSGQALQAGDVISTASGQELRLIVVEAPDS